MSLIVDKKTGEVIVSPYSKFQKESTPLEVGSMIIQHQDFVWDDEIRDFKVVDTEKEDRQAYIDSFADDCGVLNVLKKYSLTGDATLLQQREAIYADISDIPADELNVAKVQAAADNSLGKLNQLLGTNYSAEEFAKLSTEELAKLISDKATVQEKKEEVKENA